jgi:hypothetical protein
MKPWTSLVCIISVVWFEFQIQTHFLLSNQFILTLVLELQFLYTSCPTKFTFSCMVSTTLKFMEDSN